MRLSTARDAICRSMPARRAMLPSEAWAVPPWGEFRRHHTQLRRDQSLLDLSESAHDLIRIEATRPCSERSPRCTGEDPLQPTSTKLPTPSTCRSHSGCFWAADRSPSTGPETFQSSLVLEAVAEDRDGSVVLSARTSDAYPQPAAEDSALAQPHDGGLQRTRPRREPKAGHVHGQDFQGPDVNSRGSLTRGARRNSFRLRLNRAGLVTRRFPYESFQV